MNTEIEIRTWYVLETKRNKELAARAWLEQRGVESYVPLLVQWPRPVVGPAVGPMFPGYLFTHVSPRETHRVTRAAGVRGFVNFGEAPARLDDAVISFLRAREDRDGVIRAIPLRPGSEVVITTGPLQGLVAVVERRLTARQRVLLLLDILQRQTRVELPERWVRQA